MGTIRNVDAIYDSNGDPLMENGELSGTVTSDGGLSRKLSSWVSGILYTYPDVASAQEEVGFVLGTFFQTQGYLSSGDGGDNVYVVVSGDGITADGGDYISLGTPGLVGKGLFPRGHRNTLQYGEGDSREIQWSSFAATDDPSVDQSERVIAAFDALFRDDGAKVINFGGRVIGVSQQVAVVFGQNGLPLNPAVTGNQDLVIKGLSLKWLGGDLPGEFVFEYGAPQSLGGAALKKPKFVDLNIDCGNKEIGAHLIYNYYNVIYQSPTIKNFNNEVGLFFKSVDRDGVYTDDNGASVFNSSIYCLPSSMNYQGVPIKAYCGDIVVQGGYSEWCGPQEYHIGSINIVDHHWSYGAGSPANQRIAAIFHEPRGIIISACDFDNAILKFTNSGWFDGNTYTDGPSQNTPTQIRELSITGNKMNANLLAPAGYGLVTFETEVEDTSILGVNISDNIASVLGQGSNAQPFYKLRTVGSGSFSSVELKYSQFDGFGVYTGDVPSSGNLPERSTVSISGSTHEIMYSSTDSPLSSALRTFFGLNEVFRIERDGRIESQGSYNSTTASPANVYINSNGKFQRSTSAMKYKDVVSYDVGDLADKWLRMNPFTYTQRGEEDPKRFVGMSANEAEDLGLSEMVDDTSGEAESLFYERGVALNLHIIKGLIERIEALEARLTPE